SRAVTARADSSNVARLLEAAEWPGVTNRRDRIFLGFQRAALPPAPERRRTLPAPTCETGRAKSESRSRLAAEDRYGGVSLLRFRRGWLRPLMRECRICVVPSERCDKVRSGRAAR